MMASKTPAKSGTTGSPSAGEPVYLAVGMLRRPHGVRGDLLMELLTDFPERIGVGSTLLVGEDHRKMMIARLRGHKDGLLVGFKNIDTPEDAGRYRNMYVYVTAADRPKLPDGEYYFHELIGMKIVTDDGQPLGVLTEIIETGANDVFVATNLDGKELLIPAIEPVVLAIDPESKTICVHLIPGLLDPESEE